MQESHYELPSVSREYSAWLDAAFSARPAVPSDPAWFPILFPVLKSIGTKLENPNGIARSIAAGSLNLECGYYCGESADVEIQFPDGKAGLVNGHHMIGVHANTAAFAFISANQLFADSSFMQSIGDATVCDEITYRDPLPYCDVRLRVSDLITEGVAPIPRCAVRRAAAAFLTTLILESIFFHEICHAIGGHLQFRSALTGADATLPVWDNDSALILRSLLEMEADKFAACIMARNLVKHDQLMIEGAGKVSLADMTALQILANSLVLGLWCHVDAAGGKSGKRGEEVWDGYPPDWLRANFTIMHYLSCFHDYEVSAIDAESLAVCGMLWTQNLAERHPILKHLKFPDDGIAYQIDRLQKIEKRRSFDEEMFRKLMRYRYLWPAHIALPWGRMTATDSAEHEAFMKRKVPKKVLLATVSVSGGTEFSVSLFDSAKDDYLDNPVAPEILKDRIQNFQLAEAKDALSRLAETLEEINTQQNLATVQELEENLDMASTNPNLFNNRGDSYIQLGRLDLAVRDFNRAIELDATNVVFWVNRAVAHRQAGALDSCISDCTQAIMLSPEYAAAYNVRGIAYAEKGKHEEAIIDYNSAIKHSPSDAQLYCNRATSLENLGRNDDALSDLTSAIELNSEQIQFYFLRANIYRKLNRHDLAVEDFNKVEELEQREEAALHSENIQDQDTANG